MYADRLAEMSNQIEELKTEAGRLGREHDDLINEGIAGDAALSKLRNQVKEESHRRENLSGHIPSLTRSLNRQNPNRISFLQSCGMSTSLHMLPRPLLIILL